MMQMVDILFLCRWVPSPSRSQHYFINLRHAPQSSIVSGSFSLQSGAILSRWKRGETPVRLRSIQRWTSQLHRFSLFLVFEIRLIHSIFFLNRTKICDDGNESGSVFAPPPLRVFLIVECKGTGTVIPSCSQTVRWNQTNYYTTILNLLLTNSLRFLCIEVKNGKNLRLK